MRRASAAALAALAATAPAVAQPIVLGGYIEGRVGYSTDPFLRNRNGGSGLVGGTLAPTLTRQTSRSLTTLSGSYDTEQYFKRFNHTETITGQASHTQQLNEHLSANGMIGYSTTNSPLWQSTMDDTITDPLLLDALVTAQRTRRLFGNLGMNWQPSERDSFDFSVNASHVTLGGQRARPDLRLSRNYDQIGGNFGYLRTLNARTKVGLRGNVYVVDSKDAIDSKSASISVALQQQLSAIWRFDGDVGVIFQRPDGGKTSTTLGLHASLCGDYPRTSMCLRAARDSAASALGSQRVTNSVVADISHKLDERSSVSASASYQDSDSGFYLPVSNTKYYTARANYDRQLTQRLSVGASARYRRREGGLIGAADSVGGTINLRLRIGRLT